MRDIKPKKFKQYLFLSILATLILTSFLIIKDYITALLSAILLAFFILPIHKYLSKKMNKKLSAFISILIIVITILIIGAIVTTTLSNQIYSAMTGDTIEKATNSISGIISNLPFLSSSPLTEYIEETGKTSLGYLYSIIVSLPSIFLTVFLTIFISYYLLIDWENIKKETIKIIPLKNKKEIIKNTSETSKNIVHGAFLIAVISFIVSFIGYFIIGIKLYAFFAFLTGLFTFIPILGPLLVWLPLLIIELIQGNILSAVFLLILGIILSLLVDEVARAKVMGDKAKLHPIIVLIGILGGIPLFGVVGVIIGPLILSITIELIRANIK